MFANEPNPMVMGKDGKLHSFINQRRTKNSPICGFVKSEEYSQAGQIGGIFVETQRDWADYNHEHAVVVVGG
eukprot:CAMPEP_0117433090 /NCGR_PEP_ID=MMETSP0758-20121206/12498_1 /TAXON_ID=63605 /ORGANISM="Percolomonas cosmopolitus, Strain AE-1 (ATCC 50343)" /LENGTH=71 /DNA_ID=CAMNT_0005223499 /DNA_START=646 /DNA_END=857 /DNA_ORIENTATION=+